MNCDPQLYRTVTTLTIFALLVAYNLDKYLEISIFSVFVANRNLDTDTVSLPPYQKKMVDHF